jgi:hypothetical protein
MPARAVDVNALRNAPDGFGIEIMIAEDIRSARDNATPQLGLMN